MRNCRLCETMIAHHETDESWLGGLPFHQFGFLILVLLSIGASIIFLIRSSVVETTPARLWSAAIFGVLGIFWLAVYSSARRSAG